MGRRIAQSFIKLNGNLVEISGGTPGTPVTPPVGVDGYDVVVGLIQSNMRGVATDYDSTDQFTTGNVYMWNHSTSTIVPAQEPLSTPEVTTGMGASNTFLKDYAAQSLANGRKLLVINVARGGTGFSTPSTGTSTGFHWRYDLADDSNNLARRSIDIIHAAMNVAGSDARFVAFIANHGSTDGSNNTPKATFKAYLQAWIPWYRAQLNAGNVPYIMMQMRPSLLGENRHNIIDQAQQETAAEMNLVGYAYSPNGAEYNRSDSVHFNAAGMRIIGHNLYSKWNEFPRV